MQGTALAAVLAGRLAGRLRDQLGWDALRIRTLCQDIATLGGWLWLCLYYPVPSSRCNPVSQGFIDMLVNPKNPSL